MHNCNALGNKPNGHRTHLLTDQLPLYGSFSGGAGALVICSDCYDNANIYSRTREYCPYAYLEDDDPLDKTLPGLKDTYNEHDQHKDLALHNLLSNQNSSIFLALLENMLNSHSAPGTRPEICDSISAFQKSAAILKIVCVFSSLLGIFFFIYNLMTA